MQFFGGDACINYEEYGDVHHPIMLLLHGNSSNHKYFRYQIQHFQERFHIFALDTRGHGKSTMGSKELDFELLSEDLQAFVEEKGLQKFVILGFSDGGNIALTYALKYPERIECMVLNGANLKPEGMRYFPYQVIRYGYRFFEILASLLKKAKHYQQVYGLMARHPHISEEELHGLSMPVLVIAGEYDIIRRTHTRAIARGIPHSKLVIMKKAGHFCAQSCPERFNRVVDNFIGVTR